MKSLITLTLAVTLSFGVVGCSKKADVPVAEMSVDQITSMVTGTWVMEDMTMDQGGIMVKMYDTYATYNADGTSLGESKMEFITDEMPADMRGFQLVGGSNWSVTGSSIRETVESMKVTPLTVTTQSNQMAAAMQGQMTGMPAVTTKIVSVTKDRLVLDQNGTQMTYNRK